MTRHVCGPELCADCLEFVARYRALRERIDRVLALMTTARGQWVNGWPDEGRSTLTEVLDLLP